MVARFVLRPEMLDRIGISAECVLADMHKAIFAGAAQLCAAGLSREAGFSLRWQIVR